jgi:hypothetical protein
MSNQLTSDRNTLVDKHTISFLFSSFLVKWILDLNV